MDDELKLKTDAVTLFILQPVSRQRQWVSPQSMWNACLCVWIGYWGAVGGATHAAAPTQQELDSQKRYVARLADGTYRAGFYLTPWQAADEPLALDQQPLSDHANPWRWILDRTVPESDPPQSFVQLVNGDCLPGRVVGYVGANTNSKAPIPAHYLVEPAVEIGEPGGSTLQRVRVVARYVQTIAWARRSVDRVEPATLFLRRGQPIRFQSARVDAAQIQLLVDTGIQTVPLHQVAELHLSAPDAWTSYFSEHLTLDKTVSAAWFQMETSKQLRVTGLLSKTNLVLADGPDRSVRWIPGVQTAWCLERLWTRDGLPRIRRVWPADSVPVSRFVTAERRQAVLLPERGAPFRVDRNVQGGPLRSGSHDFGWGLGVHAPSDLVIPLHPCVIGLQTGFGLDSSVGSHGCVRARIHIAPPPSTDQPLFEGHVLVGSEHTVETGLLNISPAHTNSKLVLQADPVSLDPPRGADPLDIRDRANWLDPVLKLDRQQVQRAIQDLEQSSGDGQRNQLPPRR